MLRRTILSLALLVATGCAAELDTHASTEAVSEPRDPSAPYHQMPPVDPADVATVDVTIEVHDVAHPPSGVPENACTVVEANGDKKHGTYDADGWCCVPVPGAPPGDGPLCHNCPAPSTYSCEDGWSFSAGFGGASFDVVMRY